MEGSTNNWEKLNETLRRVRVSPQRQAQYEQRRQQVLTDPEIQQFLAAHQELTNAVVSRDFARLYEFWQQKQKKNGLAGYMPQLEVVNGHIQVNYVPGKQLAASRQQERVRRSLRYLPKSLQHATFANFDFDDNQRTAAVTTLMDFAEEYTNHPAQYHRGVYLEGPFGVGKTYMLAALVNDLQKAGVDCLLIHVPTLLVNAKNSIRDNSTADLLRQCQTVPVLLLDDIGATNMSAWERDDILGVLLQARMQGELSTFFSSNKTMADLEATLAQDNRGNIDELKAQRIMERIKFLAQELHVGGINRRQAQFK